MVNPEHVVSRVRSRRRPPERFHVFVSYTTREDEIRIVKPIVDRFLNSVLRPVIEQTLGEPPRLLRWVFALQAKWTPTLEPGARKGHSVRDRGKRSPRGVHIARVFWVSVVQV